jgi:hypothetical protein
MRELMGHLVARNGGEDTAAHMVAGFPQRILRGHPCRQDAIEEIAGAIPDLSLFDCGSRAGQAASAGARRT